MIHSLLPSQRTKRSLEAYIAFLSTIPEDLWCVQGPRDMYGKSDVWGHLGDSENNPSEEANELWCLVDEKTKGKGGLTFINDGLCDPKWGRHPKERVINYLKELNK